MLNGRTLSTGRSHVVYTPAYIESQPCIGVADEVDDADCIAKVKSPPAEPGGGLP